MNPSISPPKVFISYSWDSRERMAQVLDLANQLRIDGIDCLIDQYVDSPLNGWYHWMMDQVDESDFVLVVCSEPYYRRYRNKEESGKGRGVTWEGSLIIEQLYNAQGINTKFIPIVFSSEEEEFIPNGLRSSTLYRLYLKEGYEALYRRITNQPSTPLPDLGNIRKLQPLDSVPRKSSFSHQTNAENKEDKIRLRTAFVQVFREVEDDKMQEICLSFLGNCLDFRRLSKKQPAIAMDFVAYLDREKSLYKMIAFLNSFYPNIYEEIIAYLP